MGLPGLVGVEALGDHGVTLLRYGYALYLTNQSSNRVLRKANFWLRDPESENARGPFSVVLMPSTFPTKAQ